jgi:hypothetical protein
LTARVKKRGSQNFQLAVKKLGWQTFLRSKKTWLPDKKTSCQPKILTSKIVF